MNKKTLKIAGWALGLSMAVVGLGTALAATSNPSCELIETKADDEPISAFSFSRSGTTDTVTSGYTSILTTYKGQSGYYQDKSSSEGLDIGVKKSTGTIWTAAPKSISLTVKVGGGSAKNPLSNNVQAYLIDASGDEIAGTTAIVTTKVETNTGKDYTVSIKPAANAAGIMIHHTKEASYNVRIYSFSLTYVAAAMPKCTVTYKANWGEQADVIRTDVNQTTYLLEENPFDAPSGKMFKGWKAGGVGEIISAGDAYELTGDTSFYAQWVDKSSITYFPNEGTGSMAPDDFESGTTATVSANGFTAPSGYKFKTWNTQSDGKGTDYAPESTILDFSSSLDLYAIWEEKKSFTVEYTAGTTTNMCDSAGNDAAKVGLNADDWIVYSYKNASAANQIGLNKNNYMALYYYSGGDGNELHIKAKDSSPYVIQSLTLDIKQDTDHKVYKVVGSTPSEVSGTDEAYDIGGASACYVKNTKTTSVQFQLNGIELEYDYVPNFKKAQDFEKNYVRKNISYSDNTKGTACLTYYGEAIDAYNGESDMNDEARVWFASRPEFANARARMIAWAEANRKTLTFNPGTGEINVSPAAVVVTGLFLVHRRQKEEN